MDADVARGALLEPRIQQVVRIDHRLLAAASPPECARAVMAFEAHGKHCRAAQQLGIHRAMRAMAGFAAVHAHGGMLKDERPAFIGMAFQARFLIAKRLVDHLRTQPHAPRGREGAMRIVAIGALHKALVDAMLKGHGKLRPHRQMARVAKLFLLRRQQKFRGRRSMNRVAVGTDHIGLRMA